jgi:hypothetical protein
LHRAATRCQHACRLYGTCVIDGKLALVMKLYAQARPPGPPRDKSTAIRALARAPLRRRAVLTPRRRQSLDRLMRSQPRQRFAAEAALRYSLDMARAIAELHSCAIIIQDLKPPNILLDEFDSLVARPPAAPATPAAPAAARILRAPRRSR